MFYNHLHFMQNETNWKFSHVYLYLCDKECLTLVKTFFTLFGNLFRGCVKQFELNCESALSGAFTLCKTLFNDVFQCYPYFELKTRVSTVETRRVETRRNRRAAPVTPVTRLKIHECGEWVHSLVIHNYHPFRVPFQRVKDILECVPNVLKVECYGDFDVFLYLLKLQNLYKVRFALVDKEHLEDQNIRAPLNLSFENISELQLTGYFSEVANNTTRFVQKAFRNLLYLDLSWPIRRHNLESSFDNLPLSCTTVRVDRSWLPDFARCKTIKNIHIDVKHALEMPPMGPPLPLNLVHDFQFSAQLISVRLGFEVTIKCALTMVQRLLLFQTKLKVLALNFKVGADLFS